MTSKKLLLAGLIAALGMVCTSQAAVIHITPKISAILNPDFTPVDASAIVSQDAGGVVLNPNGAKYIAQIDFLMTIDDLQANQIGFANAAVNIGLTGVAQSADLPGWLADANLVDSNGPALGGNVSKWAGNQDSGQNAADLQNILVETAPRTFNAFAGDPRRSLGIEPYNNTGSKTDLGPVPDYADGEYFGSILIDIAGIAGTSGSLSSLAAQGSIYDDTQTATNVGVTGGAANGLTFQVVPEPSTLALLGLGSALLAFARKRR